MINYPSRPQNELHLPPTQLSARRDLLKTKPAHYEPDASQDIISITDDSLEIISYHSHILNDDLSIEADQK